VRRRLGRRLWAPIALAATLAIAVLGLRLREAPLTFEIGASGVPGRIGTPVQAPASASMNLQFSDGTALSLEAGSKLRVEEVEARGAGVVLVDGAFRARVVHRVRSRWLVYAGPYRVLVTGTRFDVRWDATRRSFTLELHEGAVTVFGPSLAEGGKRVLPRETLRLGPETPSRVAQTAESTASASLRPPAAGDEPRSTRAVSAAPLVAAPPSWKSLALTGDYAAALAAADTEGFANICQRASSGDLLLLGNTARLAKRVAEAEQAFLAARARPGAAHQRAVAAFQLGRLAQDARGDHARGASWFETYLNEAPDGPLAREAAGRVMEAHQRAGNSAAARLAAQRYLARYPGGPYESLARRLLSP